MKIMKFFFVNLFILIIGLHSILAQTSENMINPGFVFHTCKREVVVQRKAKVVIINNEGKKIFGKVVSIKTNSFTINSRRHPNKTVEYKDLNQLRLRKFGLPSRPYIKFLADVIGFPGFTIWHISTSKRFYFQKNNDMSGNKKYVIDYQVKEIPLRGLNYGRSILCK